MEETLAVLFSPSRFLMRVMRDEKAKSKGNFGRLVIAVHAVFLDCGFVLDGAGEPLLPDGWHSPPATVSVRYTLPYLLSSSLAPESNGGAVVLSFSATAFDVSINGSLDQPDSRTYRVSSRTYRVSFDISKLAGPLIKSMHGMNEKEEKEVLKLWKTVRDELSRPLLMEICSKNGLPVPYSLMALPNELKTRILDFLPGVDLAKIQCVCFEWKQLASSDQLWKQKFEEEFCKWAIDSTTGKEIARTCGLVDDTWKGTYAWWRMAMGQNNANSFLEPLPRFQHLGQNNANSFLEPLPRFQHFRRGRDTIPLIVRPSRVPQPWPPRYHAVVLFHSLCTCPPFGPCTCRPPSPALGARGVWLPPPGPALGARGVWLRPPGPARSARDVWFNL